MGTASLKCTSAPGNSPAYLQSGFGLAFPPLPDLNVLFYSCLLIDKFLVCSFPLASKAELPSSLRGTEPFLEQYFFPET